MTSKDHRKNRHRSSPLPCLRARWQARPQPSRWIDGDGSRDGVRRSLCQGNRGKGSADADAGKDRREVVGVAACALDLSADQFDVGYRIVALRARTRVETAKIGR